MFIDLRPFFKLLPQFFILAPAALLCYLPMKDKLKYSRGELMIMCAAVFVPYSAIADALCLFFKTDMNIILIPSFILFFIFYRYTVNANMAQTLCVFAGVCTLMTFPAQFSYAFDAWLHPDSNAAEFSLEASLFQLGVSLIITGAMAYPCARIYSKLVNKMSYPQVWYPLLAVHAILFLFNMLMIPHSYKTLYTGRSFAMFIALEIIIFLLFLFLHMIFYHMADVVLKHAELSEHSRVLEMQAQHYQNIQNYMQQTRRLRHDFRQSVHILSSLAEDGNIEGIVSHLHEYEKQLNTQSPLNYCENSALNALFNYYKSLADSNKVRTRWTISLPEKLPLSEADLAGLFGNLMENAISGCMTIPEEERRFALSVEVRQGNSLYIVSTNTFNGQTRKSGDSYLSTKRVGGGVGLISVTSVAEKYDGYAKVSNSNREFFVDIMLKI